MLSSELWWDAAIPPRDSNPETFRELLQSLVQESYQLLYDVLDLRSNGLDTILDVEYFARTIGMFEQNNVGIRLSNPAFDRIEAAVEVASTTYEEAAILLQTVEEIADNIEGNKRLLPLSLSFYRSISLKNSVFRGRLF